MNINSEGMPKSKRKDEGTVRLRKDVEKTLSDLGFRLLENPVIEGKSGISHEFDVVAETEDGERFIIKIMEGEEDLSSIIALRVQLFDTQIDKCIIIGKGVSDDVVQLAKICEMKVVEDMEEFRAALKNFLTCFKG
jgi:hypothetical protein